jgi:hypothetical protein
MNFIKKVFHSIKWLGRKRKFASFQGEEEYEKWLGI